MDLRQIPQKEALPGDIIILSDKNNYPKHAVMFDKVVNGDTLVNYSNGSQNLKTGYKKYKPLSVFLQPNAGDDLFIDSSDEGMPTFFWFKNGKVIDECPMIQDSNGFPLMWWRQMCDKFYDDTS